MCVCLSGVLAGVAIPGVMLCLFLGVVDALILPVGAEIKKSVDSLGFYNVRPRRGGSLSISPSSLIHRLIWVSLNSPITHSEIEDCNINSTVEVFNGLSCSRRIRTRRSAASQV